jgi:AcrR family transcriptional regulator
VSLRAIAAEAGVSPALVIHHFGSKEGLRQACDAFVVSLISGNETALAESAGLAAVLKADPAVRRYMARAFLDGSPEAATLFDQIVKLVTAWLAAGERAGWVQPAADQKARAALYVTWLFAPFVFEAHLARVLGIPDLHNLEATLHLSRVAQAMLRHGVFTEDRPLPTLDSVQPRKPAQ